MIREYGPWGLTVIVVYLLVRVWRSGEFLPKSVHDTILAAAATRFGDLQDRYKASQDGLMAWRQEAERAAQAALAAQERQAQILARMTELASEMKAIQRDFQELRDDLRDFRSGDDYRGNAGRRSVPRERP